MRFEISFEAAGDLILVEAIVVGPRGPRGLRLVLDTGCALTTLLPEVAEELGYSVDDRIRLSVVQSAVGVEHGYVIQVPAVTALGVTLRDVHVNVCDLGFDDLDGLLGMTFLNELNYEIRWAERRILVENRTFGYPPSTSA